MAKKLISTKRLVTKTGPKPKAIEVTSVTRDEINNFWRRKKMVEEEHLMAAQKSAARLQAKSFKEEDYRRFEQLLKEIMDGQDGLEKDEEVQAGIKDWWTKSKYAYLNQPAVKSMGDITKRQDGHTHTYLPQKICFSFYSKPSYYNTTTSFGIF